MNTGGAELVVGAHSAGPGSPSVLGGPGSHGRRGTSPPCDAMAVAHLHHGAGVATRFPSPGLLTGLARTFGDAPPAVRFAPC